MPEALRPTHGSQVGWGQVNLMAIGPLRWSQYSLSSTSPASDGPCAQERRLAETRIQWKQPFAVVNEYWQQTSDVICCIHPKPKTVPELKSALQQIWDDLPQTTIKKAISDFRKRLNSCVSAGGRHFEHTMWTSYWNMLSELCAGS